MIVLGVSGYARSGKDSIADYLVANHGFTKLSFAAPLKEMLLKLNPILGWGSYGGYGETQDVTISDLLLEGMTEDEIKSSSYGAEYRRLLQVLGTDCIRAIDEDFWVNAARGQLTDPYGRYVFSDVRMPNEAEMIVDVGNTFERFYFNLSDIWEVEREGTGPGAGCHATEMFVGELGASMTILNNDSLEELYEAVETGLKFSFPGVFDVTE